MTDNEQRLIAQLRKYIEAITYMSAYYILHHARTGAGYAGPVVLTAETEELIAEVEAQGNNVRVQENERMIQNREAIVLAKIQAAKELVEQFGPNDHDMVSTASDQFRVAYQVISDTIADVEGCEVPGEMLELVATPGNSVTWDMMVNYVAEQFRDHIASGQGSN